MCYSAPTHLGDHVVHVKVQHVIEEMDKLVFLELWEELGAEQLGLSLLLGARDEGAPGVLTPTGLFNQNFAWKFVVYVDTFLPRSFW